MAEGFTMLHKKIIVVITAIFFLVPSLLPAQGLQNPSNLTGIWKMTLGPGTHLVSFPVLPDVAELDAVLGDQFPAGIVWGEATRIATIENGEMLGAFYSQATQSWSGSLNTLDKRRGYWLVIPDDSDSVTVTLVGSAMEADTVHMGTMHAGMNLVSAGFPYPTSLGGSNLVESGFSSANYSVTGDRIYKWHADNYNHSWHHPQNGWSGDLFDFQPGIGYILVCVNADGSFEWNRPRPNVGRRYHSSGNAARMRGRSGGHQEGLLSAPDLSHPPWIAKPAKSRSRMQKVDKPKKKVSSRTVR